MKKAILVFFIALVQGVSAQTYQIVIKGGHLIDAKNKINQPMDIAINEGKVAKVASNIDASQARQVVNAKGMYVVPGLIDLHAHVFHGTDLERGLCNGLSALPPDGFTFRAGVTTVVDCGGAGWRNFEVFKQNVIDKAQTRVLSFLNIVGEGMSGDKYEQNIEDMDPDKAAQTALANKNDIVGFKLAHFKDSSWVPTERVTAAGKLANMPVIIDFGGDDTHQPLSIEKLFKDYLRPGDIYTHVYTELKRRDPIVDLNTRQLKPFMFDAQKKGIVFDVGFGGGSFNFNQAIPAIKAGFLPTTMGTDLHTGSMNSAMKDQLNVLSIFLAMGLDIPTVIAKSTWVPAQVIHREDLGHLSEGAVADLAVISVRKGQFGFRDVAGNRQTGTQKLECELTLKGGKVVYDLNAIISTAKK